MNALPSLWPGVVSSYNPGQRTCRVRIDGVTDGSDILPEAVFNNPLGDNAATTEIKIQAGDPVWLMFEGGDPRFPIIMGYRTPRTGNASGWRRFAHANIELTAEGVLKLNAASIQLNGDIQLNGNVAVAGGGLTHNGTDVGKTHTHIALAIGAPTSTPS